MRLRAIAAALFAATALAAPAGAVEFLGIPLWESYPGQYGYAPHHYAPPPAYYYDPYTGHYDRRY